jgi:predicted nucleic acid-binding protein
LKKVFVDTSGWIAFIDAGDADHLKVREFLQSAIGKFRLVTTDFVVYETLTYLNCSLKNSRLAKDFYVKAKNTMGLEVIAISRQIAEKSLEEFFFKFGDKFLSVVDATSFLTMKQLELSLALSLDEHYIQAGFQLVI